MGRQESLARLAWTDSGSEVPGPGQIRGPCFHGMGWDAPEGPSFSYSSFLIPWCVKSPSFLPSLRDLSAARGRNFQVEERKMRGGGNVIEDRERESESERESSARFPFVTIENRNRSRSRRTMTSRKRGRNEGGKLIPLFVPSSLHSTPFCRIAPRRIGRRREGEGGTKEDQTYHTNFPASFFPSKPKLAFFFLFLLSLRSTWSRSLTPLLFFLP